MVTRFLKTDGTDPGVPPSDFTTPGNPYRENSLPYRSHPVQPPGYRQLRPNVFHILNPCQYIDEK